MSWLGAVRNRYLVTADPLRTQRRIELLALLLGLLLCLQLAYGAVRLATLGLPEIVEPAVDSMRVPAVPSHAAVAEDERDEIVARPLFWPSRRPADVVSGAGGAPPPKPGQGELRDVKQVGVFGSGDQAGIIALVKGKKRRILLGEDIGGWTLESIGSTDSEFANGARRETLTLQRGSVTAAPPRPVTAAPNVGSSGKRARAEASRGAEAEPEVPAGTGSAGDSAPAPVRDTNDSLSLGAGASRR